jgi:hypothetical protein
MSKPRLKQLDLDVDDRTNTSGGLLAQGTIVALGATGKSMVACDISTPTAVASRPNGIIVPTAGVANGVTGPLRTLNGRETPVLLVGSLTLVVGDEIIVSTTVGSGTQSKSGAPGQPTSGQAINRVGVVVDTLTYDGGGDLLALVQLDFSARRLAT